MLSAFFHFDGNCREAVEFYASVFETAQPCFNTYGCMAAPDYPVPEEYADRIAFTFLLIEGDEVQFSDFPPGMTFVRGNSASLMVSSSDAQKLKKWFDKMKEGGTTGMELQKTSFSKCYGNLTDRFGVQWHFNLYQA